MAVFAQISIFFTFINNFTDVNFDVESTTDISNSLHNVVFKELGLLTGYQDNVLEYNYCTGNDYWSVFSLKLRSPGFDISCNVSSLNILTGILWFTNTVKYLQPSRKSLSLLRAHATGIAPPSIGA